MKKVLSLVLTAGMFAFYACGPSAEQKAAAEKATQDSIAAVEAAAKAAADAAKQQAIQDSISKAMEAAKMQAMQDSMAKAKTAKPAAAPKMAKGGKKK